MMLAQATLQRPNSDQTLEQILASGEITLDEQRWLISLCFVGSLSHQQEHLVNQVYEALRYGKLVVVDSRNRQSN
jgi:Tat protein secretion system quality control protein TatD with DNase activity